MISWIVSIWIGTELGCFLVYAWLTRIFGFEYISHRKSMLFFIVLSLILGISLIPVFVSDNDPTVLKMFIITSCVSISFLILYILVFNLVLVSYIYSKLVSLFYKIKDMFRNKIVNKDVKLVAKSHTEDTVNETIH